MKARNHVIYGDEALLRRLRDEYVYIGRDCVLTEGKLVVLALPRKKVVKDDKKRGRGRR